MKVKPPCFIRLTWQNEVFGLPDEEDYAVLSSTFANQGRRGVGKIKRQKNAIPDRWIFDLFKSNLTDREIAQRCGIAATSVGKKLQELVAAGILTEKALHERRSVVQHRRNRGKGQLRARPSCDDDTLRRIVRHYRKTCSTRETAQAMGVAPSTVSRYVYWMDYTRNGKGKEVA